MTQRSVIPSAQSGGSGDFTYGWPNVALGAVVVFFFAVVGLAGIIWVRSGGDPFAVADRQVVAYFRGNPPVEDSVTSVTFGGRAVGLVTEVDSYREGLQLTVARLSGSHPETVCTLDNQSSTVVIGRAPGELVRISASPQFDQVDITWSANTVTLARESPLRGVDRGWIVSNPDGVEFGINGKDWAEGERDGDREVRVWRGDELQVGDIQIVWSDPERFAYVAATVEGDRFLELAEAENLRFESVMGAGSFAAVETSFGFRSTVIEVQPSFVDAGQLLCRGARTGVELVPYRALDFQVVSDLVRFATAPAARDRLPRNRFEDIIDNVTRTTESLASIGERGDSIVAALEEHKGPIVQLAVGTDAFEDVESLVESVTAIAAEVRAATEAHREGGLAQFLLLEAEQRKSITETLDHFEAAAKRLTAEDLSPLDAIVGPGTSDEVMAILKTVKGEVSATGQMVGEEVEGVADTGKTTLLATAALAIAGILRILR